MIADHQPALTTAQVTEFASTGNAIATLDGLDLTVASDSVVQDAMITELALILCACVIVVGWEWTAHSVGA